MRSAMLFVLILTLLVSTTVNLNIPVVDAAVKPRLCIEPTLSFAEVGETFYVNINIAEITYLYAWQANITYNPDVLWFVNVTEGDFLKGQPEGTFGAKLTGEGYALLSWTTQGPYVGVSGSGTLATLEFQVLAEGESPIEFRIDLVHDSVHPIVLVLQLSAGPVPNWRNLYPPANFTTHDGYFASIQSLDFYNELFDSYNQLLASYSTLLENYTALLTNYNTLNSTYQTLLAGYQDLQGQYENLDSLLQSLNSTYNSLTSDYDTLHSKYDALASELNMVRNVSYILGITTVAFAVTTAYFVLKRPKVKK